MLSASVLLLRLLLRLLRLLTYCGALLSFFVKVVRLRGLRKSAAQVSEIYLTSNLYIFELVAHVSRSDYYGHYRVNGQCYKNESDAM